ncbi:MAG: hypothetical protein NTU49_06055 [Gammaproteobacteria bacterium]|nr:hypothetical protein [Gammaproteobacteria bacterium]
MAGIPDGLSSTLSALGSMMVVLFCGRSGTAPLVGIQAAQIFSDFANFHASAVYNVGCNKIGRYVSILNDKKNKFTVETKNIAAQNARIYAALLIKFCLVMSSLACGVAFLFAKQLAAILVDELKIQGVFQLISGLNLPASCVLAAVLDNRFILYATTIFEMGVNPGAAAAMHYGLNKTPEWVFAASEAGTALMTLLFMKRCYDKFKAFTVPVESNTNETQPLLNPTPSSREPVKARYLSQMIWAPIPTNDDQKPRLLALPSGLATRANSF